MRSLPLSYVTAGDPAGPTLVLLHGIMSSAISQSEAIEHWATQGYRVIALDARGHGLSPRWDRESLRVAEKQLVTDVVEFLSRDLAARQALSAAGHFPVETSPAIVIAHSMGAATAMVVGLDYPELVRGVVLCDPARFGQRSPHQLAARALGRMRHREHENADLPGALARLLDNPDIPRGEAVAGLWASQRSDNSFLGTGVVAPERTWEEAMAALAVPTLLVTGDRPGSARVGEEGLAILKEQANPHVQAILIPGAGHDVRRTRSKEFYAAVDPWLAAHTTTTPPA